MRAACCPGAESEAPSACGCSRRDQCVGHGGCWSCVDAFMPHSDPCLCCVHAVLQAAPSSKRKKEGERLVQQMTDVLNLGIDTAAQHTAPGQAGPAPLASSGQQPTSTAAQGAGAQGTEVAAGRRRFVRVSTLTHLALQVSNA